MIREIEKFENAARLAMGNYDIAAPSRIERPVPGQGMFWLVGIAAFAVCLLFLSLLF